MGTHTRSLKVDQGSLTGTFEKYIHSNCIVPRWLGSIWLLPDWHLGPNMHWLSDEFTSQAPYLLAAL